MYSFFMQVTRVSSVTKEGMPELWSTMEQYRRSMTACGELARRRKHQRVLWMRSQVDSKVRELFYEHPSVLSATGRLEELVENARVTPGLAADVLVQIFTSAGAKEGGERAGEETLERLLINLDKEIL
jgi:LAO/AO transport system kinase